MTHSSRRNSHEPGSFWKELQSWSPRRRRLVYITAGAGIAFAVFVLLLLSLLAQGTTNAPAAATAIVLPVVSGEAALAQLQAVTGLSLNAEPLNVDALYGAVSGYRVPFVDGTAGELLLLAYADAASAASSAFVLSVNPELAEWRLSHLANIILLVSPAVDPLSTERVIGAASQFLIVPYIGTSPAP